jgi:4-amino-4-deoxy-L-arabinose transferase-like glycosyltransferase
VNRAIDAFHHKRPFYYYFTSIWYILAPWSLFIAAIVVAAWRKRTISTSMERLFLAIAAVTMFMLSAFSSKVDVYLLPALPFFVALALLLFQKNSNYSYERWFLALPIGLITIASGAGLVLIGNPIIDIPSHPFIYVAMVMLFIAGVGSLYQLFKAQNINQCINTFGLGLLLTIFLGSFALPAINDKIGYEGICKVSEKLMEQSSEKKYYRYHVRRGENMDVYLKQSPIEIDDKNFDQFKDIKGVLIYRTKDLKNSMDLQQIVSGKPNVSKGAYTAVLL